MQETFLANDAIPTPVQLARRLVEHLRASVPPSWAVDMDARQRSQQASHWHPYLELRVRDSSGTSALITVEVRRDAIAPRDLPPLVAQAEQGRATGRPLLVAAPHISRATRESLAAAGINYFDAMGNMRLRLERPALFIERQGSERNPWAKAQVLRTLRGPAAGRVIRALCDFRPPYGLRELAQRAATPAGTVSKILALLEREALITRATRGKYRGEVLAADWQGLIRRWTQDYTFGTSNSPRTYLEPRGLEALFAKLRQTPRPYAVTGSFASIQVAPIVQPRLATLFVADLDRADAELGLRPAERGANVVLAQPFDPVVFARTVTRDGLIYAALSQVAADLLTGPGRGPQEGSALLAWMREHEDAWRA